MNRTVNKPEEFPCDHHPQKHEGGVADEFQVSSCCFFRYEESDNAAPVEGRQRKKIKKEQEEIQREKNTREGSEGGIKSRLAGGNDLHEIYRLRGVEHIQQYPRPYNKCRKEQKKKI